MIFLKLLGLDHHISEILAIRYYFLLVFQVKCFTMAYWTIILVASIVISYQLHHTDAKFSFAVPGKWGNNKRVPFTFALPGKCSMFSVRSFGYIKMLE